MCVCVFVFIKEFFFFIFIFTPSIHNKVNVLFYTHDTKSNWTSLRKITNFYFLLTFSFLFCISIDFSSCLIFFRIILLRFGNFLLFSLAFLKHIFCSQSQSPRTTLWRCRNKNMKNNINVFIIPIWCVSIADIFFILLSLGFHYKPSYHTQLLFHKEHNNKQKKCDTLRLNFSIIQKTQRISFHVNNSLWMMLSQNILVIILF